MGLVVVTLAVALCAGKLLGGNLTRLAGLPWRGWPLLAAAFLVELTGAVTSGWWYPASLALCAVLVLAFLVRNRAVPGVALVCLGLLLNAAVVAANGAMPVSRPAATSVGVDLRAVAAGADPRHEIAGAGTRLARLGDVLPVPWPGRGEVASPGDAVTALGLALLVVAGMRRAPVRYRPGLTAVRSGAPPWPASRPRIGATLVATEARRGTPMAKRSRKRKARAKNKANHGKKPNA